MYNVTIDANKYDELLANWLSDFFDIPDKLNIEDVNNVSYQPEHLNSSIESHFSRASSILNLLGSQNKQPTLQELILADPLPTLVIDVQGRVLLSNAPANKLLAISKGAELTEFIQKPELVKQVTNILGELAHADEDTALGLVQIPDSSGEKYINFVMSKIYDKNMNKSYLRLSALQTLWNEDVNETLRSLFHLTNSELDIAKRLVAGAKLKDIAIEKQRSINTVRVQCKSLLKKTKLKTQSELIKLLAILQTIDYQSPNYVAQQVDTPKTPLIMVKQDNYVALEGQRKLYYEIYGRPNGRPILFLHGMISGTKLSQELIRILWRDNIKLICPHRAGFGYSEASHTPDHLASFIEDMRALLDQEKIKKCPIFGHLAGAYYAYLLGNKIPKRVEKIRIVNGCVPHRFARQINVMPPRQRVIAYTALYTPKLLPFILKAGIAQAKKRGMTNMMYALFGQSKHDIALFKDDEIGDIMINGFESCIANGIQSFVNDTKCLISGNWVDMIANCNVPIEIFHGKYEHTVPVDQVRDLAADLPKLSLTELDGAQMILYQFPDILFKNIYPD